MGRRFLFLTWDGAGNQGPALGWARALSDLGDEVVFAGSPEQAARISRHGFAFHALPAPAVAPDLPVFERHRRRSWANPLQASAVAALAAAERIDALVIDCLMFGALAGAEGIGLPAAVLVHSPPGALVPPGGSLESLLLPAVNTLRHELRLGAVHRLQAAWRPFFTLCASIAELDPPGPDRHVGVSFVGASFEPEPADAWRPPWPTDDPRPLILAAFSTGRAWDQASRIARTLDAVAGRPYRALVTTALTDVSAIIPPDNAVLTPFAPHLPVLRAASATVTHAGHGTLAASLQAGVPVVCLPNQGADQYALAAQLQMQGAGLALDGDTATPEDILRAIREVIDDPRYADAAARLGESFRRAPGPTGAAMLLQAMAEG